MSPKLKKIWEISWKNGLNALLVNTALMGGFHDRFNFDNWAGVKSVLFMVFVTIGAREASIWIPVLLKLSQSAPNPEDVLKDKIDVAETKAEDAAAAVHDVKDAAAALPPKP